jgi:hypothetical protein
VTRRERDLAARYLDVVVRLLPGARRGWGAAMQAELTSLSGSLERVRFALSCTRGVLLATPARGGSPSPTLPALAFGACAGLIAGAVGFVVLPFERIGDPLAAGLPGGRSWLALIVFAAPCTAALVTAARTRCTDQAVMSALCGAAFAALVAAVLGLAAIALFPGSVPDIVGPVMVPGTSAAARQSANAIEASDPYYGLLVVGGMLLAMVCVMARPPRRADVAAVALLLLALPPVLLAASADHFPGSAAITFSILGLLLAAAVTVRPRRAASAHAAAVTR